MSLRGLCAALLCAVASAGIYPEDHWSKSTKLTNDNFEKSVKDAVDGGKTMFAPEWDAITTKFKDNADVAFGDVNLSEGFSDRSHNPGMGGWPTVKHFNKQTGYKGAHYKKKTSDAMCTELGPGKPYLQQYVEEAGGTSLCSVATKKGCSDKESGFIKTWQDKLSADAAAQGLVDKQIKRLSGMRSGSMKAELKEWVNQRLAILKQLKASSAKEL